VSEVGFFRCCLSPVSGVLIPKVSWAPFIDFNFPTVYGLLQMGVGIALEPLDQMV
jgi:hypothetical protein